MITQCWTLSYKGGLRPWHVDGPTMNGYDFAIVDEACEFIRKDAELRGYKV